MGIKAPEKTFACMAEAVAFYHKQGFATSEEGRSAITRIMRKENDPLAGSIMLWKKDFLLVVAIDL